jgi:predicted dehydrogenase
MSEALKVAVIGAGLVGRMHIEACRNASGVLLVGFAEPGDARRAEVEAACGVAAFNDVGALLREASIDAAIVATPVATHERVVTACAKAGVHVLCEKPLAVTLESAAAMIAACDDADVQLGYAASYRYLPAIRKARELIRGGVIGDVLILREQIVGGSGPAGHAPMGFAHYPKSGPGGSGLGLMDHGVHLIDAFAWLVGAPVSRALGRGNISGASPSTEFLHMEFANGALGHLLYNDGTYADDMPWEGVFSEGAGWTLAGESEAGAWLSGPGAIHIHGTRGALRLYHYANHLYLIDSAGQRRIPLAEAPPPAHFIAQVEAFGAAIRAGIRYAPDGESGQAALKVLHAAYGRPFGF